MVPFKDFNHIDFLCGNNDFEMIYARILHLIPYYIKDENSRKNQIENTEEIINKLDKNKDFMKYKNSHPNSLMKYLRILNIY